MENENNLSSQITNELAKQGLPNDFQFLKVPSVRRLVNEALLSRSLQDGALTTYDNVHGVRLVKGGLEHNMNALLGALHSFDRGSQLVDACLPSINPQDLPSVHVLHIGNRNFNEILCSIGHGVLPENVTGLDLISMHPIVRAGDMHCMPFESESFDVVIAGWVLAYSQDVTKALSEIKRVLKSSGRIAIGWDMNALNYYGTSDVLDGEDHPYVESVKSIEIWLRNAGFGEFTVVYQRDPTYPFDAFSRQCIAIIRMGSKLSQVRHDLALAEGRAVGELKSLLINHADSSIHQRLEGHEHFCRLLGGGAEASNIYPPEEPYMLMRSHWLRYGESLDTLISTQISKVFPPIFSNKQTINSKFFGVHSASEIAEISNTLRNRGIYVFPALIDNVFLNHLRRQITYEPSSTAREFSNEAALLKSDLVLKLWIDELFLAIAEQYFQAMPILDFVAATKSRVSETGLAADRDKDAQMWHFDKDRIKFLKVFVYLTDCDDYSGPHQYIPGTHAQPPARDGRLEHFEIEATLEKFPPLSITGKAGTVFIEDTHGLHRGTPLIEGAREMIQFEYCNSLFGQRYDRISINCFLPKYEEMVCAYPRLFQRFL